MAVNYGPAQLVKGAMSTFMTALAMEPVSWIDRIATLVPSTSNTENYAWLGDATQMVEAEDELNFDTLSNSDYDLANKKYWAGLEVKRDDINDAQTTGYSLRIRDMAKVGAQFPNKLLTTALINGTSATLGANVFAGAFFATDHAARNLEGGDQSNLLTGTGVTTALLQTDLATALTALMAYKLENGEPANEGMTKMYIMCHPTLMFKFTEVLNAAIISNTTNVQFRDFAFDLLVNPRLSDTNDWYLGRQDSAVRGLVFQDREPLTFEAQEGGNDNEFIRETYRYKTRRRGRAGYGLWQYLAKTTNT